jgi:hypothetical protein
MVVNLILRTQVGGGAEEQQAELLIYITRLEGEASRELCHRSFAQGAGDTQNQRLSHASVTNTDGQRL